MFNALSSLGAVSGAEVADLFAGSGALGIEALSRGAASCTFVESDPAALAVIRSNVAGLGLGDRSDIVSGRVETALRTLRNLDLVLADPPYGYEQWGELLSNLESALSEDAIVVLESGSEVDAAEEALAGWEILRCKRYGRTWVTFLHRR